MSRRLYTLWFVPHYALRTPRTNGARCALSHRTIDALADQLAWFLAMIVRPEETLVITTPRADGSSRVVAGFFPPSR